ncbi:hypothetical protein BCR33DRAFT_59883 [Rhizoclosmatium globosum]|uniref:NF-X1-type domain-containing protein n=1 Tax=Rhizoclosmatium globosum TaxID=329046 RepID=A0A1Y2CMK2_9FUNG|nr:hypothetical protein BCR33DRAFT_59883 [Rhizoclosmatium globosum]|eukprot:ORY48177.1 hypothetical protein BCR33DRAFT_59883 [Rhizoclosmatium globosum]
MPCLFLDVLPINRDNSDNSDGVFACQTCFKVFHAPCLREWAKTANAPEFRCPACNCPQDSALVAEAPRCFCGKTQFAALSPTEKQTNQCANSCARVRSIRGLKLADAAADYSECACPHPCSAKCHPGPCEPCSRFKSRTCHCGRLSYQSKCGVFESKRACDAVCGKKLNCGLHTCQKQCHSGPCNDCQESVSCTCFCSATTRKETCGSSQMVSDNGKLVQKFTCNNVCNKLLSCGNHSCSKKCHKGACATCSKSPSLVNSCPCGKTTVMRQQRTSCLDPIPTCDSICDKTLSCGHRCLQKCHNSDEPCVCIGKKTIPCECGKHREEVACTDLVDGDSVRTTFKCNSICKTLKTVENMNALRVVVL